MKPIYWAAVFLASALCVVYADFGYDTLWHIPTGNWILDHWAIPTEDVFSATKLGSPWMAHEWLSEVVFAVVYRAFGWPGVLLLTAASFAIVFALLARFLEARAEPVRGLILFLVAVTVTAITIKARPQAIAAPILVFWAISVAGAAEQQRAPSLYLLPLMALWANLHASFIVGLGWTALLAMEAITSAPGNPARLSAGLRWGAFFLAALLASLITPHGIQGLLFPIEVQRQEVALQFIREWQPYQVSSLGDPLVVWLLLVIAFSAMGKLRLGWVRLLGILALLFLAMRHVRHFYLLGLLSPLLLATPLCGRKLGRAGGSSDADEPHAGRSLAGASILSTPLVVLALAGGLAFGAAARSKPFHPPEEATAQGAIDFAKGAGLTGPVFNAYGFGATLIFNGLAPFIDGRADVYGDEFIKAFADATWLTTKNSPTPLFELLDQYGIEWTLFPATAEPLAGLSMSKDWNRVYEDDYAVIFRRVSPRAAAEPVPASVGNTGRPGM